MTKWIPGTAIKCEISRIETPAMPPVTMDEFGQRLRAWRKIRQLNQNQLSLRSRVSRTSISHYECGYYHPHRDTLLRLARALNVEEHFLNEIPGKKWLKSKGNLTGKKIAI